MTASAHALGGIATTSQGAGVIDLPGAFAAPPGSANQGLFQPVMFPTGTPNPGDLLNVDLTGSNWQGSNWQGSNWQGSNWQGSNWQGSNWQSGYWS